MNATKLANLFGIVFVLIGILGFVPAFTPTGNLLGLFEVNALHNIIHIISGIAALILASSAPKTYFKIFGIVYLIVTVVGFIQGTTVLGLIGVNLFDNLLHLVITVAALSIGFSKMDSSMKSA